MVRMNLAGPGIFYLFAAIYLIVGVLAVSDPAMLAINPGLAISGLTILAWIFGLLCLFLGFRLGEGVFRLGPVPLVAGFIMGCVTINYLLGIGWLPSIILNCLALLGCWIVLNLNCLVSRGFLRPFLVKLHPKLTKRVCWELMFLGGLAVFLANMLLVGIPLLNPALHNELLTVLNLPFIFGFYVMIYSSVRFFAERKDVSRGFLLIILIFSILSTFRSYMVIAFFTWLFLELGGRGRVNPRKILPLAAVLIAAFFAAVFIGHSLALVGRGEWSLGPLRTAEYRIGFTNTVFNDVVERAFPWGYSFGESLEKPFGLYTCHVLYGCEGRLTSALLGEPMMDFGLPAVLIVMVFTGAVLQGLYRRDYPLYALLMAHLIIALEISAGYFFVLIFAYLGYLGGWKRSQNG